MKCPTSSSQRPLLADRLLPLTGAPALVADRLTELASVRDGVRDLLTLSKQRMVTRSSRPAPIFAVGDFVFLLSSKGLHIHSQKCKHLRDQRLGPFQVLKKVGLKSYRLKLPPGCRLHPARFIVICFPKHLVLHLCVINLQKLEATMSMQSIIYRMVKLIIGRLAAVVSFFNFRLVLLDMMSFSGCYLNKLMIVNKCLCSCHHMSRHNFPKHKLIMLN